MFSGLNTRLEFPVPALCLPAPLTSAWMLKPCLSLKSANSAAEDKYGLLQESMIWERRLEEWPARGPL